MAIAMICNALLAAFICPILPDSAVPQLDGRFFMAKETFMVGEPVYLYFDLINQGDKPVQIVVGNVYSFCGGFQILVSNGPPLLNSSCASGIAGSCIATKVLIRPGEKRSEKVLLNYEHDFLRPGKYRIAASRLLNFGPPSEAWAPADYKQLSTSAQFEINLIAGGEVDKVPLFEPYVNDLESKDEERLREAARVIGSLAPQFLEETIFSMLDRPQVRQFALTGLKRLNTSRAREALARIVSDNVEYSYEKEQAVRLLSTMGDKRYFPLLLNEARRLPSNQARDFVQAAAVLGGEDALQFIDSLLRSSDPSSRANGVMALPHTASRRAVPILIGLLRSVDSNTAVFASIGLLQLTHMSPRAVGQPRSGDPSRDYQAWTNWWKAQGTSARIFAAWECGEVRPLN